MMTNRLAPRPQHRPRRGALVPVLLFLLVAMGGCEGAGEDRVFDLGPTGIVDIQAFIDVDRSGTFGGADRPLVDTPVGLRFPGSVDTLAFGTTNPVGEARFTAVPAGALEVFFDESRLGDSLVVSLRDPDPLRLISGTELTAVLALSYPVVKILEAREWAADRRIFVEGVAVSPTGALPGDALHIRDDTGWLRAEGTSGPALAIGDSVRIRGVVHREGGSTVLRQGLRQTMPGSGAPPTPIDVTSHEARNAGPALDGALVRITDAAISQTVFQGGVATAQLSDGSGPLMVQIPQGHLVQANLPIPRGGGVVEVTGVLIPQSQGTSWLLRTRSGADIAITSTGTMTGRVFIPAPDDEDDDDGEDDGEENGDENGNGEGDGDTGQVQGAETPLSGVRVLLRADQLSGDVIAEGVTDSDGRFRIEGLPTGAYQVELDPFTYPEELTIGTIEPSPALITTNGVTDVMVPLLPPEADGSTHPQEEQ